MGAQEQGANATAGRWVVIPRTLCFVLNGEDVLLMKRSPQRRVFPNRYNGVGGHIERDEDPLTSVRREITEETGLVVHDVRLRAVYNVDAGEQTGIVLFVFTAISDSREIIDCDEGTLHWIPRQQVLALDLVDDLPTILPRILKLSDADAPLFVHISYDGADRIQFKFAESANG
ncbi:MAG TPA: NUDIX domain-containing protein [Phototrophicaceae bacterium]|nr:NUDIX domain-containing protein [Phototrophicaceae bacterium]